MFKTKHKTQNGVSLIEVIVGISVVSVILIVVGFSVNAYVEARSRLLIDTKKMYLVEEGYEMLRMIRDNNWNDINTLTMGDIYYFSVSTSTIAVSTTPEIIDGTLYREFVVENAYRDGDDDLVDSSVAGAVVDINTKIVTIFVGGVNATTSLEAVLTNINAI